MFFIFNIYILHIKYLFFTLNIYYLNIIVQTWKLGFGATFLKANQQPALYQWLVKLRAAILAKFSLYFHTTLSQQASSGEMRSIVSKQGVDYYHKYV